MLYTISDAGVALVAKWEGLRLNAYIDTGGVPTIGYGTTRYFDQPGQPRVRMGDVITEERATFLLHHALDSHWAEAEELIEVPLEQYQVDALASFVYNIGVTSFAKSTMLRKLNAGDYDGAANEFPRWNRDNGRVIPGLTNRRMDEQTVFRGY